jgi:hypothetical protein
MVKLINFVCFYDYENFYENKNNEIKKWIHGENISIFWFILTFFIKLIEIPLILSQIIFIGVEF